MTTKVILADEISGIIHDIFAGEHFLLGYKAEPSLYILSPWISNVEIKGRIPKMGPVSPQVGYTFESMDLAHAILLARLLFDVEVNLVTKSPNEETYTRPTYVKSLLDFLDEIGCSVFIKDNLHSKVLFAGKIAIVGSMNLTKSALHEREEIAVSIDDFENLFLLEEYASDVMKESKPYGYTAHGGRTEKVTRGWLYQMLGGESFAVFQKHDLSIENILSNIETFYLESISGLCKTTTLSPKHLRPLALQAYNGPYASEEEAMTFIRKKLARRQFPQVSFKYKNVSFNSDEYIEKWEKQWKKKTRLSKRN